MFAIVNVGLEAEPAIFLSKFVALIGILVCSDWTQVWEYDDFYTLTAVFRRVYEA